MPGVLEDIKVLDLSRVVAGPTCAMILGDLGADIIKVERPGSGDEVRHWGPPYAGTESVYYLGLNRNKRSLSLNFKSPAGKQVLRRMAREVDVIIENFKTGDLERAGLGYEDLSRENPALIYCSISGYGRTGPDKNKPGYDFAIQGRGGYMSITGQPDGPPTKVGLPVIDVLAALNAAVGVFSALRVREATGRGQLVDVSLLDAEVSALVNQGSNWLMGGMVPQRWGNANPNVVPYQTFRSMDGWFNVAVGNNDQFARLCDAIGAPLLAEDPRYATNDLRIQNRDALVAALTEKFRTRPTAEWLQILSQAKVPTDPIQSIDQVFSDPQILAREMLVTMPHPTLGEVRMAGNAIKLSDNPVSYRRHPPLLGEHTEEVLGEFGHTKEEIRVLRSEGVI
ncbi:MAG: CoA transferase [Actinobacteria bacterium]|nr:CoA transferase [Actinomycetota bacterium]